MLLLNNCVDKKTELHSESTKTMNDQKEQIKTSGQFSANDKQGVPVIIEWQKTTLFAPEFAAAMKEAWPLARETYTPVEVDFLKTYPQVVGVEDYFKPFEHLFKNGVDTVDWTKVEETMQEQLKSHFIFDTSTFGPEVFAMYSKDDCYVVKIKNKQTGLLLGFITFMKRANYKEGELKVMSFAIDQDHQGRGLGRLLMSSILKMTSNIQRIFLCTRVTNDNALKAYKAWGFLDDKNPIMDHAFNLNHWKFLEYKVNSSDILQKTASGLTDLPNKD